LKCRKIVAQPGLRPALKKLTALLRPPGWIKESRFTAEKWRRREE